MVPEKPAGHAESTSINRAACASHAARAELAAVKNPIPPAFTHSKYPTNAVVVAVVVAEDIAVVVVVAG